MSGIERTIVYGVLGVLLAGTTYVWRRVEAACETRSVITRESVETGTLRAQKVIVSGAIELVREDGKTVGFLMSGPRGGFLNLFDPDPPHGGASIGCTPSGDRTAPWYSMWAGLGNTGIRVGTTLDGRRLFRTWKKAGQETIEETDYEFDGEKLSRAVPR